MFNKIIYLPVSLVMVAGLATAQQKPFTLNGNIKGKTDAYIYLYYADEETGKQKIDSSLIQNGRFSFQGVLNGPAQATVVLDKQVTSMDKYLQLFLVPGNMELALDYDNFRDGAVLKGSPVQAEADALNKSKVAVNAQLKPFSEAYNKANNEYIEGRKAKKDEGTLEALKEAATKARDAMDPYYAQLRKKDQEFMDQHPASFVTASILRYGVSGMPLKEGEERYGKLPDDVKSSGMGKAIKKELDGLRMGSPGANAYMFASKELRGEDLKLSDYKGKYVLLDFWASWCVPCRKGNPHLLSLYSKYKGKGFEIVGVSDDDRNHDAWQKAVDQDKIGVWKHVLRGYDMDKRLKGERNENDLLEYYGIHSLPTKILIDPNGVIIGRYGGGGENDEAMDKKLSEVFGG